MLKKYAFFIISLFFICKKVFERVGHKLYSSTKFRTAKNQKCNFGKMAFVGRRFKGHISKESCAFHWLCETWNVISLFLKLIFVNF
jgi:hypothetical protein